MTYNIGALEVGTYLTYDLPTTSLSHADACDFTSMCFSSISIARLRDCTGSGQPQRIEDAPASSQRRPQSRSDIVRQTSHDAVEFRKRGLRYFGCVGQ